METFWRKGYAGTSLSDLTATMEIERTSLYAAFGSKEGLFREAVARYVASDGAEIWGAVEKAATAYDAIEGYLMATARLFSRKHKPTGCLIVLSGLYEDDASATVREEIAAQRKANQSGLVQRLKVGVADGEISAVADLAAIARFYITVQQGMSIQARDGANQKALESIARTALEAWPALTKPTS